MRRYSSPALGTALTFVCLRVCSLRPGGWLNLQTRDDGSYIRCTVVLNGSFCGPPHATLRLPPGMSAPTAFLLVCLLVAEGRPTVPVRLGVQHSSPEGEGRRQPARDFDRHRRHRGRACTCCPDGPLTCASAAHAGGWFVVGSGRGIAGNP